MYARASTCGGVGMAVAAGGAGGAGGAGLSAIQGTVANAVSKTQARKERSIS
jgi:hypothetical protein